MARALSVPGGAVAVVAPSAQTCEAPCHAASWLVPVTGALCPAFREAAAATADAYGRGRLVGIVPWETTFTDMALMSIAVRLPGRVLAQRFGAAREATTGADWQWWFKDDTGYAGMRVQAKRRDPGSGSLGLRAMAPPPPNERQARRLVRVAAAEGLTAFYCFYSYRPPQGADPASTGPCPHGSVDADQWGASLLLARSALRHAEDPRPLSAVRNEAIAATARPWWQAVCPDQAPDAQGAVEAVRTFVRQSAAVDFAIGQRLADHEDPAAGAGAERLVLEVPVGDDPPPEVVRAFERASLDEVDAPPDLDGMALFDASGG